METMYLSFRVLPHSYDSFLNLSTYFVRCLDVTQINSVLSQLVTSCGYLRKFSLSNIRSNFWEVISLSLFPAAIAMELSSAKVKARPDDIQESGNKF